MRAKAKTVIFVVCLLVMRAVPAQASIGFGSSVLYPVGTRPGPVALASLNSDYAYDLLVGGQGTSPALYALLGQADGGFRMSASYPLPGAPTALISVDVDGDYRADAVVGSAAGLGVFHNNHDGTLSSITNVPLGGAPVALAVGYNVFDQRPDIVSATPSGVLLTHVGPGPSFTTTTLYPASAPILGVAVADVTGDGIPDVLFTEQGPDDLVVLEGNRYGTFQQPARYPAGPNPVAVLAWGYFTDGYRPGVVVASGGSGGLVRVRFLLTKAGGGFEAPADYTVLDVDGWGRSYLFVDRVDDDARWDIIVGNENTSRVAVLKGTAGGFEPAVTADVGGRPSGLALLYPGIAATREDVNAVSVLRPVSAPGFVPNLSGAAGIRQVSLTWDPPYAGGASTSYEVYRSDAAGQPGSRVAVVPSAGYLDGGLEDGATYYYRVRAVNQAGPGPFWLEVSATTFDVPSAPLNVVAQPGAFTYQIAVSWEPPASDGGKAVTGYTVCRHTGISTSCADAGMQTSVVDDGLLPLATYTYTVSARNAVGPGPESDPACSKPFPWVSALGC